MLNVKKACSFSLIEIILHFHNKNEYYLHFVIIINVFFYSFLTNRFDLSQYRHCHNHLLGRLKEV